VERPAQERRPGQQEAFILNRFRTPVRVSILAAAFVTAGCAPTEVQVYATTPQGLERLAAFTTDARSGYEPGAAETMGAGAAAGTLEVAAAVSAGPRVLSETLSADVEARRQAHRGRRCAAAPAVLREPGLDCAAVNPDFGIPMSAAA